jgi:hypothetical protein
VSIELAIFGTLCVGGLIFTLTQDKKKEIIQSVENMSKGKTRVGIQGSGKTMAEVIDAIDLLNKGYKFCWLTTQGERQCKLIDFIPQEFKKDIELFAPYMKGSKGFNFLKCYTNKENERMLRADAAVILIDNMSDRISDNMKYGIKLATLAVLEYWWKTKQSVTLYDAWMFIRKPTFRDHVLKTIRNNEIAEEIEKIKDETQDAISRKFGFLLSNKMLLNALCYTHDDALDFQEIMNKIFICDFIEDNINGLGSIQAIALAQAIIIQFDILASTRNNDSTYYEIKLDEFYRYAKGIENVIQGFPDRHRQRRIALSLIWQRMSQMNDRLVDIALSMVNKYFHTLEVDDDAKISNKELYKPYKGQFSQLKEREYISFLNTGTGITIEKGRTRDIESPNPSMYGYSLNNCRSKFTKEKFKWWFDEHNSDAYINTSSYQDGDDDA